MIQRCLQKRRVHFSLKAHSIGPGLTKTECLGMFFLQSSDHKFT